MTDTVKDAQDWYLEASEALGDQRRQVEDDLKFSDPSDPQQWDDEERRQREKDPGGARPCLTMDQTSQYTATVVGQIEQSPPSLHALPAAAGAEQRVAEKLDGLFRNIEYTSRATQHYIRALTSAARTGVGYLILRPEYTDRALNHQEPRISSEGDPLRVMFDPWSTEIDGSDADRGQLLTSMSPASFERQFGTRAKKVSFGDVDGHQVDDAKDTVLVAEEWRLEVDKQIMLIVRGADGDEYSLSEDDFEKAKAQSKPPTFVRDFTEKTTCVKWVRMSGAEVLTPETEYPADGIGIVPVYGYTSWSDGRLKYCGIPRRAREPQRAYNYHVSEIRARMNSAPKAPWLAALRAIRGVERLWDRASVDSRAYLPYNDIDEASQPIAPPSRMPLAVNLQNEMAGIQQASHDIQASLGMYQATLGAPSNETSGVAIDARKQQGEAATSIFPNHLSASVARLGQLTMSMIPRLVDTKRQMRILGLDSTPGHVVMDPKQKEALQETNDGLVINPNVGKYDVRVVVGAPFSTQRQQAQQAFTEMMRGNPSLTPAIAPLWAGTLDIPNADKLQQVLTAMAPPAVQAILQPDGDGKGPTSAQLLAENQKLKDQLQQAVQIAHDAQADADQAHNQLAEKAAEHQDKGTELAINAYNAETNRLKVIGPSFNPAQVQAVVQQELRQMLSDPSPWPGEPAQAMPPAPDDLGGDPSAPIPQMPHQLGTPPIVAPALPGAAPPLAPAGPANPMQ